MIVALSVRFDRRRRFSIFNKDLRSITDVYDKSDNRFGFLRLTLMTFNPRARARTRLREIYTPRVLAPTIARTKRRKFSLLPRGSPPRAIFVVLSLSGVIFDRHLGDSIYANHRDKHPSRGGLAP